MTDEEFQEPKYEFVDGRVRNRASGELIPQDEPVFVFRARDNYARDVLSYYASILPNDSHRDVVVQRYVQFASFADDHPERMKKPDTESLPA